MNNISSISSISSILINFEDLNKIEKFYKSDLITKLNWDNKTEKTDLGLIFIIPQGIKTKLLLFPVNDKHSYMLSEEFVKQIIKFYWIRYNKKEKICKLCCSCGADIELVLDCLTDTKEVTNVPGALTNSLIYTEIPLTKDNFDDICSKFVNNNFGEPYINNRERLVLIFLKTVDRESILNKISHLIETHDQQYCSLFAKFSDNAIKVLSKLPEQGIINGVQKELTGELFIQKAVRKDNPRRIIYIIDIDEKSVTHGDDETVNVKFTRYNFHSHPKQAYVNHSISLAWPSSTDYVGYLTLGKHTIFHCVSAIEGLYIISFSEHWGDNLDRIDKAFVKKNFDIPRNKNYSIQDYLDIINNTKFENYPIFEVKFFNWNELTTKELSIKFPRIGGSCLITQSITKNFAKINSTPTINFMD